MQGQRPLVRPPLNPRRPGSRRGTGQGPSRQPVTLPPPRSLLVWQLAHSNSWRTPGRARRRVPPRPKTSSIGQPGRRNKRIDGAVEWLSVGMRRGPGLHVAPTRRLSRPAARSSPGRPSCTTMCSTSSVTRRRRLRYRFHDSFGYDSEARTGPGSPSIVRAIRASSPGR